MRFSSLLSFKQLNPQNQLAVHRLSRKNGILLTIQLIYQRRAWRAGTTKCMNTSIITRCIYVRLYTYTFLFVICVNCLRVLLSPISCVPVQSAFRSFILGLCSLLPEIEHKRQTIQLKLHNESAFSVQNACLVYIITLNSKTMSISERKYINDYFCNIVIK